MRKKSNPKEYEYRDNLPRCLKFLKNSSLNTQKSYFLAVRRYEEFHNQSITELVCEALDEQTNGTPQHLLKIIDRLEDFQEALIQEDLVHGTILNYVTRIKTIYHRNRVTVPYIEPLNPKRTRRREYIEYKDILTKEELKKAVSLMRLPSQARLMTMIQGGLSNEECEHLTTRAFIDELYKYHQKDDDLDALKWLADENHPVIWITKLIRVKTGKPYYAIIGAEAVNKIAEAKIYESTLPMNNGCFPNKLLNTHKGAFGRVCTQLNHRLGLGIVADTCRLRPHMLRKFHSTYIKGGVLSYEENSLISNAEIDEMQGRGKTNVQDTYIKTNPIRQKLLYAKVMNNLCLYNEYDYKLVNDDVILTRRNHQIENQILREEVKNLNKDIQKKREASDKVKMLRQELGNDVFDDLISEILSAK